MEAETADGMGFRIEDGSRSKGAVRPATSAPAPGLFAEPASILAVWAAAGPGIAGGGLGVPPGALLRSFLSIARGELDFKLVDLVPLGFGSLPLRYREQLLQALTRGNGLLRRVHAGIIAHVPGPRVARVVVDRVNA